MFASANMQVFYECFAKSCQEESKSWPEQKDHVDKENIGEVEYFSEDCEDILKSIHLQTKEVCKKKASKESCMICGKSMLKRNMLDHLTRCMAKEKRDFHCTVKNCQSSFALKRDLLSHVYLVHQSSTEKCPIGNCTSVVRSYNLIKHVKTVHLKATKVCEKCGKLMSYGGFRQHVQRCTSDGERSFRCTFEGCKAEFTTVVNRSLHVRRVHAASIKCPRDDCCGTFRPSYLNRHIKQVHDNTMTKCQLCHKNFNYLYVKTHEKQCKLQ